MISNGCHLQDRILMMHLHVALVVPQIWGARSMALHYAAVAAAAAAAADVMLVTFCMH
jgi:hypothetical protein